MNDVSIVRLYMLRATYLLIAVGLAIMIWPGLIDAPRDLEHMRGVVRAMLGAVGLLALLGLRYPIRMLPLILFEFAWKSIWLMAIGLPLWSANAFNEGTRSTWNDCLISVVLFLVVIPWGYVWTHYIKQPGDRWRNGTRAVTPVER